MPGISTNSNGIHFLIFLGLGIFKSNSVAGNLLTECLGKPKAPRSVRFADPRTGESKDIRDVETYFRQLFGQFNAKQIYFEVGEQSMFSTQSYFSGAERIESLLLPVSSMSTSYRNEVIKELSEGNPTREKRIQQRIEEHMKQTKDPISVVELLPEVAKQTNQCTKGTNCILSAIRWSHPNWKATTGEIPYSGPGGTKKVHEAYKEAIKHIADNYIKIKPGEDLPLGALILVKNGAVLHAARYMGLTREGHVVWHDNSVGVPLTFENVRTGLGYYINEAKLEIEFYRTRL